jgi:hypothetical protein
MRRHTRRRLWIEVAEWLDRKQEEVDNRFYRSHQQPPEIFDAARLRRIRRLDDFYDKSRGEPGNFEWLANRLCLEAV